MKLLCLIDSLCAGGAQRQLCMLAVGMKKRGHEVRFIVYHPHDHFLPLLHDAGIACEVISPCSYVQRAWAIRKILRHGWQDVVLAFLEASSLYAELAGIAGRRWGLVVGERTADPGMMSGIGPWLRQFHRLADAVVCNSHTNQLLLEAAFPFLRPKLATVYNTADLSLFRPDVDGSMVHSTGRARPFRIVVAARYHARKNMMHVAKALLILKETSMVPSVVVDWFGTVSPDPTAFNHVQCFVVENGLGEMLRLNPPTRNMAGEYARADAVGLFSYFEGLPNVVCEGMACGKPILMSNVCDAGNLVQDGVNGFLCDPVSPEDIADKVLRMVTLNESERQNMGMASRRMAEHLFAEAVVIEYYERILTWAARRESMPADCTWPTSVPFSAVATVKRWVIGN